MTEVKPHEIYLCRDGVERRVQKTDERMVHYHAKENGEWSTPYVATHNRFKGLIRDGELQK